MSDTTNATTDSSEPPLPQVFGGTLQEDIDTEIAGVRRDRIGDHERLVKNLMESQTTRAAQVYMLAAVEDKPNGQDHLRDIGDGNPVRVKECPACGVSPGGVDDCGHFGDPDCPYFGIGREELERREDLRSRHNV